MCYPATKIKYNSLIILYRLPINIDVIYRYISEFRLTEFRNGLFNNLLYKFVINKIFCSSFSFFFLYIAVCTVLSRIIREKVWDNRTFKLNIVTKEILS
jgi:hypothetical protein